MSDESIVNLSDTTKATMRNYAMVAGFMIIFIYVAISAKITFEGKIPSEVFGLKNYLFFKFLIGASLIITGSVLAFLHKRDLVAITFILVAITILIVPIMYLMFDGPRGIFPFPALIVSVILGVAMLFTRNEQKYVCVLILLPFSIIMLILGLIDGKSMYFIAYAILAAVSLYSALCIGLENPKFPGYRLLTADEEDETKDGSPVHFKVSGSILGFALIMTSAVCAICGHFNLYDAGIDGGVLIKSCEVSCGLMLIFVGFLMLTAGRMKFTPFVFMMIGITMALRITSVSGWLFFLFFLVIGLMCLLRSDRRILVGASVIALGLINLTHPEGIFPCAELCMALAVVSVVILSYVCFALCSDDRLKLI